MQNAEKVDEESKFFVLCGTILSEEFQVGYTYREIRLHTEIAESVIHIYYYSETIKRCRKVSFVFGIFHTNSMCKRLAVVIVWAVLLRHMTHYSES